MKNINTIVQEFDKDQELLRKAVDDMETIKAFMAVHEYEKACELYGRMRAVILEQFRSLPSDR